ncbi:MAG: hypothetical protein OEW11_04830 [Nitrospirota bacterium]|nr:hypothetical protein [Nitrospirota bacterium]
MLREPGIEGTQGEPRRGGLDVDHDLIAQVDASRDRYQDSDLYQQIHRSQRTIPWWLVVMLAVVVLLAVALNAPFLTGGGANPMEKLAGGHGSGSFLDMGMALALLYVGGGFAVIFWFTWRRKES